LHGAVAGQRDGDLGHHVVRAVIGDGFVRGAVVFVDEQERAYMHGLIEGVDLLAAEVVLVRVIDETITAGRR